MFTYTDEIKRLITMRGVMDRYGVAVNRSGFAVCPFHTEKTASLKVYPGSRGFHCFGCGAHGSVIDFVKLYFGLNFQETLAKLNDDFGLRLPLREKPGLRAGQKAREAYRERLRQRERRERLYARRDAAGEIWCACDFILMNFPVMSDEWCSALKNISAAAYNLDCAEEEVAEFELKQRKNGGA